jgi:hypothetical protein
LMEASFPREWSGAEDALLAAAVTKYGARQWKASVWWVAVVVEGGGGQGGVQRTAAQGCKLQARRTGAPKASRAGRKKQIADARASCPMPQALASPGRRGEGIALGGCVSSVTRRLGLAVQLGRWEGGNGRLQDAQLRGQTGWRGSRCRSCERGGWCLGWCRWAQTVISDALGRGWKLYQ